MPWLRHVRQFLWRRPRLATVVQVVSLIVTVVLAFAWQIGDAGRLEPITLMVAASSALVGLLSTQLAPPVPHLPTPAVQELMAFSDPYRDWERVTIANPIPAVWRYRWDRSLTITDPGDTDRTDFDEPWMPAYWNGNWSFYVSVRVSGDVLFDLRLISIDGGRSVLPYPHSPTDLRITKLQDTIARIVKEIDETHYQYDRYLQQASIIVTHDHDLRLEPLP